MLYHNTGPRDDLPYVVGRPHALLAVPYGDPLHHRPTLARRLASELLPPSTTSGEPAMKLHWLMAATGSWLAATTLSSSLAADPPSGWDLFSQDNLVAWCIVPFDARKRGPRARAEMLQRLGIRRMAYDWRAPDVPTFEEEILQCRQHGLEFFAFWSWHDSIGPLIRKHHVTPQIWLTLPSPKADTQSRRVEAAARQLLPRVNQTRQLGCKLGLYNHGGWGGEPSNMIAVAQWLRAHADADHVGIVYNLHHGHAHINDFGEVLRQLKPWLLCLNLNGMNDNAQPMILPVGAGKYDRQLLTIIANSGYSGPIGILDHRNELDAEQSLRQNLEGLQRLVAELRRR